jgi:hypothetical protein
MESNAEMNCVEFLYEEGDNMPLYALDIDLLYTSSITFKVARITSWGDNDAPLNGEHVLKVIIKWDGCSHFNFGDENGYLHLCGGIAFEQLGNLLRFLYHKAFSIMENTSDKYQMPASTLFSKEFIGTLNLSDYA